MSKQPLLLLIHGPNFAVLEHREEIYKGLSLTQIKNHVRRQSELFRLCAIQSDEEGKLVRFCNQGLRYLSKGPIAGIIINAGAYSHTSLALADALAPLASRGIPICEVHLTHVQSREPIRHTSMLSKVLTAQVSGMGLVGYTAAVLFIKEHFDARK